MRKTKTHTAGMEDGFTLFEVVVAIALLGMILAAAFGLVGAGLGALHTSREYTRAVLLAKQKLYEISLAHPGTMIQDQGVEGTMRWSTEVVPEERSPGNLPAEIFQLRVRISWPGRSKEKFLEMVTLATRVDEAKLAAAVVSGPVRAGGARP